MKNEDAGTIIHYAAERCSLGSVLVARSGRGLCAILLGDAPHTLALDLQSCFPRAQLMGGDGEFQSVMDQVVSFIEAPGMGLDMPLDVHGTSFQQRVWQALEKVPAGSTVSYADIAQRIGSPTSARAVAGACAANTLAVAIPCHRVLRTDGGLSGYRWGIERKRALLRQEGAIQ